MAVALLAAALVFSAAAVGYELLKRPADVHNPDAIFMPQKPPPPPKEAKTVNWPMYGLNPARTRYLPAKGIKPPFRKLWRYTDRPLLEFPPIYVGGKLYFVNNNGFAYALDADTGKALWERRIGAPQRLLADLLPPPPLHRQPRPRPHRQARRQDRQDDLEEGAAGAGRVLAGGRRPHRLLRLRGRRPLRAQHDQRQRALGDPARRPGQVGARLLRRPPLRRRLRRLHERGRRQERQADLAERLARARASAPPAQFYSTPAVAYGRVYSGNNDGRVYSFDISDGELAWSYSTGGYAYSGPTVANTQHSPPTVFIGSFDGNVYALDAKDGSVRWSRSAGGQVIGSLSAVGDIVYVAEFTDKTTTGFMMRSGKKVFEYPYGTYTPVISDGRRIYLTGYSSITALEPFKPASRSARSAGEAGEAGEGR